MHATKPPVFRRAGAQLFFAPLTEIFRIAARQRHGEKRGVVRGEKNTAGADARTRQSGRRKTKRLETADASGRRRAAAAPEGRTGHAPARHADARESAASGQAAQTDGAEAASGRGSRPTSTPHPAAARPRTRTAERRRDGRRRRRPGGTRTREQSATHATSAEKTPRKDAQAASAADAEREGQGAPANPPELLGLHPLGRGRTRQKRGAAARRPPTAFRCRRILCDGRRSGWADGVSLPSLPRFMACGEQLSPFCRKNAQKGEKRKKGLENV